MILDLEGMTTKDLKSYPHGTGPLEIEEAPWAEHETTVDLVNDHEHDAFFFRSLEKQNIKLNHSQLKAVRHLDGPALVLAGAGSGKTRVLTSRAGYLLSLGIAEAKNMLLITFTRKAAEELKERLAVYPGMGRDVVKDITVGTYHSVFLRLLRGIGDRRKILSSEKYKHLLMKLILKEKNLHDEYEPEILLSLLSSYKNKMIRADEMPATTETEKEIKNIFQIYENKKRETGYMDFDDILLDSYILLKKEPGLLKRLQEKFIYIFCDEWQDTNPVQYELIKMIAFPENHLYVVGDDDQTIYEFNGADSSIILNFPKQFPGTKTYFLDINYRSNSKIVGLANKMIAFNKNRFEKTLKAAKQGEKAPFFLRPKHSDEEAKIIGEKIVNDVREGKRTYRDFAVLFRNHSNSRAIFEEFVLKNIPFVTFGHATTFYEQSFVKPVIDHLRLAINGKNIDALDGILPTLYLNREKTLPFIEMREFQEPEQNLLAHAVHLPELKPFQQTFILQRLKMIEKIKLEKPADAIKTIRKVYDKFIEADERKSVTLHKELLREMLAELQVSAKRFDTIPQFLAFIDEIIQKNREMEEIRTDPHANVVKLMTIHKSKGLEFPAVYVIGVSEGILPHAAAIDGNGRKDIIYKSEKLEEPAIEEERRLLYVAVTRAKDELYISSPEQYRGEKTEVSRFLTESLYGEKTDEKNKNLQGKMKAARLEIVWQCKNRSCNAWKRISSDEEYKKKEKQCPMCGNGMTKETKEIFQ